MAAKPTNRVAPCKDERHFNATFRWPERCRVLMVGAVISGLTYEEEQAITQGGHWPNKPKVFKPIYDKLVDDLHTTMVEEADAHGQLADLLPSRRSIVEAAKKWTKNFLCEGDVHDKKPQQPGDRLLQMMPELTRMREILLEGYQDCTGQMTLYRDIEDACKKNPEFHQLVTQTGLKTERSVWKALKKAFPKMATVKRTVKKDRDAAAVQVCTASLLSLLDPCQCTSRLLQLVAMLACSCRCLGFQASCICINVLGSMQAPCAGKGMLWHSHTLITLLCRGLQG